MFESIFCRGIVSFLVVMFFTVAIQAAGDSESKQAAGKVAAKSEAKKKSTSKKAVTKSRWSKSSGTRSIKKDGSDKKKTAKPLKRRILYYHAPWCIFCQEVKKDAFPKLKLVKWRIGTKATDHIQEINTDQFPKLMEKNKIELLPAYVLIVDGKEVDRRHGILSAYEIAELYYGRLKKDE